MKLHPFQQAGVNYIDYADDIKKSGTCLLGDEQGLGKTIQALAWLKQHPEAMPAVIVCPATLKLNWQKELLRWCPTRHTIANGRVAARWDTPVLIINYDVLIEDRLATANFACSLGLRTYLVKRPWNLGRLAIKGVERINDLGEFYMMELERA